MPCNEPPYLQPTIDFLQPAIDKLIDAVIARTVAAERERCANIAESMDTPHHMYTRACREIAEKIRGVADPDTGEKL